MLQKRTFYRAHPLVLIMLAYHTKQAIREVPGYLRARKLFGRRGRGNRLVGRATRICIEGFPRSANSFALFWLTLGLNVPETQIAHHTHTVRNIGLAVERSLPTFVLVRRPLDAATSLVAWGASPSLQDCLEAYEVFHGKLFALKHNLRIVETEDFLKTPGTLMRDAARALDRPFPEAMVGEISERVRAQIEALGQGMPNKMAAPNARKAVIKMDILSSKSEAAVSRILERCELLREALIGGKPKTFAAETVGQRE
jgi:hypothetical protein